VPVLIENKPEVPYSRCDSIKFWTLFSLNAGVPLFEIYTIVSSTTAAHITMTNPSEFTVIASPAASIIVGLLQCFSGYIMVKSVFSIRKFFKKRNATNYINIPMLLRHSVAFVLYLLSTVADYGTFALYLAFPNDYTFNLFMTFQDFWVVGGFVSQVLLCQIFWDLGTDTRDQNESSVMEVFEEDFDEDA
jgi:hypothetical protein